MQQSLFLIILRSINNEHQRYCKTAWGVKNHCLKSAQRHRPRFCGNEGAYFALHCADWLYAKCGSKKPCNEKTYNIAFSMPLNRDSTQSSYFLECLFGVCKQAAHTRYDIIVVGDDAASLQQIVHSRKADGVILTRDKIGETALRQLAQRGVPLVVTGSTCVDDIIQISYDARTAFRDLTMRLMKAWQGDFALLLTYERYPANVTRAEGFTDAHTGFQREPCLIKSRSMKPSKACIKRVYAI